MKKKQTDRVLHARVPIDEYDRLKAQLDAADVTIAQFIRRCVREEIKKAD